MKNILLWIVLGLCASEARAGLDLSSVDAASLGTRAAPRPLADWIPRQRHVLLVVDPRHARAQAFLDALAEGGYPAQRTTILLVGSMHQASLSMRLDAWREAQVLVADREDFRRKAGSDGLVVAYGIDAGGRIAWRRSGWSGRAGPVILELLEWLR